MLKNAKYRKRSARIISATNGDPTRCDILGTDDQGRIWEMTRGSFQTKNQEKKRKAVNEKITHLYKFLEKNGGPASMEDLEKKGYDLSMVDIVTAKYSYHDVQMKVFAQENGYLRSLPLMIPSLSYWNSPVMEKVSIDNVRFLIGDPDRRPMDHGLATTRTGLLANVSYRPNGEMFIYNIRKMRTRRYEMTIPIRENVKKEVDQQLKDHDDLNIYPPEDNYPEDNYNEEEEFEDRFGYTTRGRSEAVLFYG